MGADISSGNLDAARDSKVADLRPTTALSAQKMRASVLQTLCWLGLYLLLCLSPLVLLSFGAPTPRGFWLELGVGLGVVGFAILALQSLSIARFRHVAPFFGSDAILLFHRQLGFIALFFVLAHPLLLLAVEPRYIEYLDPHVNALRAIFLIMATIGVILLVALPPLRKKISLEYEWWRLSHAVFAAGVLVVGLVHGLQVGHYLSGFGKQIVWVLVLLAGLLPIVYVRLVRPWLAKKKAYRVEEVRAERGDTSTLVLRPDRHEGFSFAAGQFAWLTLGNSPFRLQQHPYSLAGSSVAPHQYRVTIKALGDFSSTIPRVSPGSRAFLDGPYGSFSLGAQPLEGAVLIMGGIGITPAISMLRTCRDLGERRRLILIYANESWDEVAFREELGALEDELDLEVVHVLNDPPKGWQGETGLLRDDVLERHLPRDGGDYHYFVCGPPPMMAVAEKYLATRGVPIWNRSVERFEFA
jgi:predicted ferric reductase